MRGTVEWVHGDVLAANWSSAFESNLRAPYINAVINGLQETPENFEHAEKVSLFHSNERSKGRRVLKGLTPSIRRVIPLVCLQNLYRVTVSPTTRIHHLSLTKLILLLR